MKAEFMQQYAHTWRVFARLVADFEPDGWLHTGRGLGTPARLSWHILQAAKVYMQTTTPVLFASGKPFDVATISATEEALPSQADVLDCIEGLQERTKQWLSAMDFDDENCAFPWAGAKKLGVVLFLLRHNLFHIGELSSLLNESKNGAVDDHYVKALGG